MTDIGWLAEQAKQIYQIFASLFYVCITVFLLLGVFVEYFKWPLGGAPAFSQLIGRALVAVFLLHAYPDISNLIADLVDGLAVKIGGLNQFNVVLDKMGEKLHEVTWSWVSVKDIAIWIISFVTFFLLYISVHAINAFELFAWTILYVTAPFLISLFVFPATSGATKSLFKSLIEVGLWKVMWAVLATLLWSFALSHINQSQHVSFVTVIFLNLILAGSVLLTPFVVHALAGSGFSSLAATAGGIVGGATMTTPLQLIGSSTSKAAVAAGGMKAGYAGASKGLRAITPKKPVGPKVSSPPKWHKDVPWPKDPHGQNETE